MYKGLHYTQNITVYSFDKFVWLPQEVSQDVTVRQPDFEKVLGDGQNLLAVAHPKAVPILQSKLQQLRQKWMQLRGHIGESEKFP